VCHVLIENVGTLRRIAATAHPSTALRDIPESIRL
jgi:hypothetical protein